MTEQTQLADDPRTAEYGPAAVRAERPLRVLMPSYRSDPFTGGQGVYMRHVTKALVEMGHHVDVISGPPYPVLDPRVGLIRLPSLDLYAQPKTFLGVPAMPRRAFTSYTDFYEYMAHISGAFPEPHTFGMRMVRYMRNRLRDYDIVHDNQTLCRGLLHLRRMGLPVVGTVHHPITRDRRIALDAAETFGMRLLVRRWYSFLDRQIKVARRLDPLIVVSRSTLRDVETDFGIPPERMAVVHHGIDTEQFRPLPHIARRDNLLITTASADVPLKGLIYLVEAYAMLLADHPDLELLVIGRLREGHTARTLRRLGLLDRVRFVSGVSDEELTEHYARATIAVSPSVYEGFGFPAGEAMACGVPVVATTGGSLPEVVGDAGVLTPVKDPAALAAAIGGLLRDPARRAELGAAGRQRMLAHFQWSRAARELTEVYYRALNLGRAHADREARRAAA